MDGMGERASLRRPSGHYGSVGSSIIRLVSGACKQAVARPLQYDGWSTDRPAGRSAVDMIDFGLRRPLTSMGRKTIGARAAEPAANVRVAGR